MKFFLLYLRENPRSSFHLGRLAAVALVDRQMRSLFQRNGFFRKIALTRELYFM